MYNDKSKKSEVMNEQLRSLNEQTPAGKNSISNKKPAVFQSANYMDGYFSGSCNGGMLRPITYKKVMAGEKIYDYSVKMRISMLTPKTPAYQKLKMTLKCFFVPDSRVWTNSEKFYAQKGGSTVEKISEIPNLGAYSIPFIPVGSASDNYRVYTDTELFRDSWVSSYLPKYQTGKTPSSTESFSRLPKYNVLPLRGFKAIYNDFLRNKEYDSELTEFFNDNVSQSEFNTYFANTQSSSIIGIEFYRQCKNLLLRGRRQNSYYTDYRTELLGDNVNAPSDALTNAVSLSEWQKQVAELRSQAENAQLNDWDIISKIRGSKPLEENKVILLGEREIGLNYHSVPQDTYNLNSDVQPEFQVLGQLGSYSYTEASVNLFQFQEFKQEGFLHVIAQVSADTVFESGFERTLLNITPFDNYRPDLVDLKNDVLYDIEKSGTRISGPSDLTAVTGFKRKYSEYFKLPNICQGDLTTGGFYKVKYELGEELSNWSLSVDSQGNPIRYNSKRSYQFFEIDDRLTHDFRRKNLWQDYTDLLINKNQAIMQDEITLDNPSGSDSINIVQGQNQIFFLGIHSCVSDLPMDDKIKNNYTKWGEI